MEAHENTAIETAPHPLPHLLLRPTEAAEVLGVSRATIYRLLDNGSLGSVWVRTLRRIPMAEVERYISGLVASQETKFAIGTLDVAVTQADEIRVSSVVPSPMHVAVVPSPSPQSAP